MRAAPLGSDRVCRSNRMSDTVEGARLPVSATIITRNEAAHIEDCIRSLWFADEIVVVDSCSTDDTRAIAEGLGAHVIEQEFLGHVRQKQLAVDRARHDWIFSIDADERVSPELADALRSALESSSREPSAIGSDTVVGFFVPRHTFYLGRFIDHGGWWPEWRLRLFDRRSAKWGGTDPHDHVVISGKTERLDGELVHFNYRDLSHHVEKIDSYSAIIADRRTTAGERASVWKLLTRPPLRFLKMFLLRGGFRDGTRGFIVAWMGAFYVFMKYAKLWEKQRVDEGAAATASKAAAGAGHR